MTIRTTARVAGPFAAGAQSLPFAFKVFAASDICVVRRADDGTTTHLFIGLDYGVTLHANQETTPGGTVSLTVATPAVQRPTNHSARRGPGRISDNPREDRPCRGKPSTHSRCRPG